MNNPEASMVKVATLDQVQPGQRKLVFVDDEPVALFNIDGQIFCLADLCTHDNGPLADGELFNHQIECPRHGARFDIRTGQALTLPATAPIPVYRVQIEGNDILIDPSSLDE
jgi:3-phenylpropionate/trans-cinnamate dioxygenase ferredoxin subunit